MRKTVLFSVTIVVYLLTGRAPGMPELRNPDAEKGAARTHVVLKRAWS